ncbi:VOC family protein [Burkholderia territorii]|uniref:Glyoxalase n=1 Tax=Burkholderia territorii TaxID=1503055 RepID=A0A6L3NNQ1_9BURK|nr:VOC family protein [Burkholderia territorii]KAB0685228.1 glyoxalase [Burkholderia territorii]MBM2773577.1 VOC family protein [Burkholderia territorii]VWB67213.1 biphenyl 2,3-dioxygenase [Burkholderia territorii]
MKVTKLAYVGTHASDLDAWKDYAPQVLGLEVSRDSSDKLLYLRADERHHRLSIHPGESNDIAYIGWEVANHEALDAMASRLDRSGIEVQRGTASDLVERRVLDLVYFTCPHTGVRMELTVGNEVVFNPRFVPTRPLTGFKTGELGLGHVVLYVTADLRKVVDFYVKTLGFGISDWVVNPEGTPLAAFLHCNARHHSLALIFYPPAPRKIQHVFFETNSLDDVGTTYDLCRAQEIAATGIGRHPNDRSVSFYFRNPSRWFIEYGWDLRTVDPQNVTEESYVLRPGIGWGHEGLRNLEDGSNPLR